jgi:hypothetical protein
MSDIQLLVDALFIIVFLVLPIIRLYQLLGGRKYDFWCFFFGFYISFAFFYLMIFSLILGRFDLLPQIISSYVIAILTLALVWVELSKRPELKLGDFWPILYDNTGQYLSYKAGYHNEPIFISKLLHIKEVSYGNIRFENLFSFSFDLSNIGYEEIMVHDYTVYINEQRAMQPIPLGANPNVERLKLITQQRFPIDIPPLRIDNVGFHKMRIVVSATTLKCQKDVWFVLSDDFMRLRYVEMYPLKRLFSYFIKKKLNFPPATE